jgi:hypothetical protein
MSSPVSRKTCKRESCTNLPAKPGASLCLVHIDEIFARKNLRRIGPYVKAAEPIEALCLTCGSQCSPRLADLQNPTRGGCVPCGIKRRAESKSVPASQAAKEFLAAGLRITGEYVNVNTPVDVECTVCGEPGRTRLSVLRRGDGGCIPCGIEKAKEKNKTPTEQIRQELLAADMEMIGDYVNKNTPVKALCLICGKESDIWMSTIYSGGRCRWCTYDQLRASLRTDAEQVRIDFLAAGFQLISSYRNNAEELEILCLQCGTCTKRAWKRFRNGQRACRTCEPLPPSRPRIADEVVRAEFMNHGLKVTGTYEGSGVPLASVCVECDTPASPTLGNLRSGQGGCKTCASRKLAKAYRAPLDAIRALYDARDLDFIGPYTNALTPTPCVCRRCGKARTPKPNALLRAGGCKPCGYAVDVTGYLYLIDFNHDGERFVKVGIGRKNGGRIKQHLATGGVLLQALTAPFVECYEAEQEIIKAHQGLAYRPFSRRLNGGHTECFLPFTDINLSKWLPEGSIMPESG